LGNCTLDNSHHFAERHGIAAIFRKSRETRRLRTEQVRGLPRRIPAPNVMIGAVAAQNEDMNL
jgi:hypothetical protein